MEMHVYFSLDHPARSELSVRHITGSLPSSQTKFWQEPHISTPRSKLTSQDCGSSHPSGPQAMSHLKTLCQGTLPCTFLTANPPWYGNLRRLSAALEMPAKNSGLCTGCPEKPSVQQRPGCQKQPPHTRLWKESDTEHVPDGKDEGGSVQGNGRA